MAAILITVKNNLYSIKLDIWEWTGLKVNGNTIQKGSDRCYTYVQTTEGVVDFSATANYVTTVNPDGNHFVMKGAAKSHIASLVYSPPNQQPFDLQGLLINVTQRQSAKPGPFSFSQGMMTGVFAHG